jgi:hypothetical protein
MDPVIADLNRYLTDLEDAIDEEEAAEEQLRRERLDWALRLLSSEATSLESKARMIVACIEDEVEEALDGA